MRVLLVSLRIRSVVFVLSLAAVACENSTNPTSPSTLAQVGGSWNYTQRLTSVSGGECIGTALQGAVGATDTGTLSITQTGSSLSASMSSDSGGGACSYTGTVNSSSIVLTWTRCDGGSVAQGFPCQNGALRDVEFVSNPIDLTSSVSSLAGTSVETYHIYTAGTTTRVGVLTVNASFNATKRRRQEALPRTSAKVARFGFTRARPRNHTQCECQAVKVVMCDDSVRARSRVGLSRCNLMAVLRRASFFSLGIRHHCLPVATA